jgi:S1-C subfamily serine protease
VENSSAEKAGLSIGDIIVEAANKNVNSAYDIRDIIKEKDLRSGDRIAFKIYRDGVYLNIKLRLGTNK